MQKLYKFEQETIILWNEDDHLVDIKTFDKKLIASFNKAAELYPEIVRFLDVNKYGCMHYQISREFLRISVMPPVSEETRQKLSDSGKQGWAQALASKSKG